MRNMKHRGIIGLILSLLAVFTAVSPVFAYSYYTTMAVTSTAAFTNLPVIATINNTSLIASNYITSSGLDTLVTAGGTATPHMVADGKTLFVAGSVLANSTTYYNYEMGNTALSAFSILTGYGGYLTTTDAAALEPGAAFEVETNGYFNTSAGGGEFIFVKPGGVSLQATAASQITAAVWGASATDQSFSTVGTNLAVYGANWYGQTFTAGVTGYITGVTLYLTQTLAPAGDFTVSINTASAGLPTTTILTSTSKTANTIGAAGDESFTFTTPVYLIAGTQYSIVASCPSGDAANYIYWMRKVGGGYAGGNVNSSANSGATWSGTAGDDFRFSTLMTQPTAATIVANAQATGLHDYKVNLAGGTMTLYDGITSLGTVASGAIPDTAYNWQFGLGNSAPYYSAIKITVGGTLIAWYQPITIISGTTLPDREGAAQNATITWGTNPASVSVAIGLLVSGDMPTLPAITQGNPPNVLPGGNQVLTGNANIASSPFYPFFTTMQTVSGGDLTVGLQAMMFSMILAIGFLILGAKASQGRSFFLPILGLGAGAGIGFALKLYQDVWILYILGLLAAASMIMDARKSW